MVTFLGEGGFDVTDHLPISNPWDLWGFSNSPSWWPHSAREQHPQEDDWEFSRQYGVNSLANSPGGRRCSTRAVLTNPMSFQKSPSSFQVSYLSSRLLQVSWILVLLNGAPISQPALIPRTKHFLISTLRSWASMRPVCRERTWLSLIAGLSPSGQIGDSVD